jgi:hypothetical protein
MMVKDRGWDLLLVSLGEGSLFPVRDEFDFIVFAGSTPRDARISTWKTLKRVI